MKIGLNARFLVHPNTGIGQYTLHLLKGLAKVDLTNEYFIFTPEAVELNLPENFHIIRVPEKDYKSASLRKAHWEHILVPQEMEKHQVNVAHFLYPSNPRRKMTMPVVVTMHDVIPWVLPEYRQKLRTRLYYFNARLALKKADHLITVSEFSKSEIMKLFKVKKSNISVVYHAPPFWDENNALPAPPLRRPYILYVGGYDDRKNVPRLILAYQKHIAPYYPIDLILVGAQGKGFEALLSDEHLHRVNKKHPLKPRGKVIFTQVFDDAELATLYKQAYLFANVSLYEGFNLPLVEAMHYGIPIVTSDVPVHHEVTGETAVFVNPHSVDAIGLGLHELLNHPKLMSDLKKKGKAMAEHYSWEKSAKETMDVYNLFA